MLMGMRGAKHRFMPNRLVFPGGASIAPTSMRGVATSLSPHTEHLLRKKTNAKLAHGLAIAAARELHEETGLSLGAPPQLDVLYLLARAVTPPPGPIRFNARFLTVDARHVTGSSAATASWRDCASTPWVRRWRSISPCRRGACWNGCGCGSPWPRQNERCRSHTPVMLRDRGWLME